MTTSIPNDSRPDHFDQEDKNALGLFPDRYRESGYRFERQGGYLVEKFDDRPIRLKRPASARKANSGIDFDPYRTYIGPTEGQYTLSVAACTLGGILALGALIAAIALVASS